MLNPGKYSCILELSLLGSLTLMLYQVPFFFFYLFLFVVVRIFNVAVG